MHQYLILIISNTELFPTSNLSNASNEKCYRTDQTLLRFAVLNALLIYLLIYLKGLDWEQLTSEVSFMLWEDATSYLAAITMTATGLIPSIHSPTPGDNEHE